MQAFLHAIIVALWFYVLLQLILKNRLFRAFGLSAFDLKFSFILKCAVGVGLWAIYTYYYPFRGKGDTFRYFDDAMVIYAELWKEPGTYFKFLFGYGLDDPSLIPVFDRMNNWSSASTYGLPNDTQTVIRLNMLIALLSGGVYWVHLLFFNLLSLTGLVGVYALFSENFGKSRSMWWAIVLLPNALFWGSGLLKEAPFLAAFGWYVWALSKSNQRKLVLIITSMFLIVLKPYIFVAMLPASFSWIIVQRYHWNAWITSAVVSGISFMMALNASVLYPAGDLLYILSKKQEDFYNTAVNAGSTVYIEPVGVSALAFIASIPNRIMYTYGRPYLWESKTLFYIPPAVENIILVAVIVWALLMLYRHQKAVYSPLIVFIVTFSIALAIIIGSTVPVLGALVRYKLPAVLLLYVWCIGVILKTKAERVKQN
ncbi:MAG: hypothetical protein GC193_05565 [Cryomorphaceae bacterium]|nr:hypothetical protein [Cryomorphaceae bacterium]